MRLPILRIHSFQSYLLVTIQLLCLGGIVLTGPVLASSTIYCGLELMGLALGVWALATMTVRNLNILPDIRTGSRLVTHGPYQFIRHPMYTSLLLITLALILDTFSWERFILWLILLSDLWIKLNYEEKLLSRHFEEYRDYQKWTKRLIPFLL
jgi:protein-S-isoprenylcysteine O-methyltransferase Ste14